VRRSAPCAARALVIDVAKGKIAELVVAVPAHLPAGRAAWRRIMISVGIAHIQPVVALIAGVLILVLPRLLNIIVAIYLILVGLAGLGVLR
jgi:hypothetical protein